MTQQWIVALLHDLLPQFDEQVRQMLVAQPPVAVADIVPRLLASVSQGNPAATTLRDIDQANSQCTDLDYLY